MPKLRLSLCRAGQEGHGPWFPVLVEESSFRAISTAAANKMQLKGKKAKSIRLFVRPPQGGALVELVADDTGKEGGNKALSLLENGVVVIVAVGGDAATDTQCASFDIAKDAKQLPPLPLGPGGNQDAISDEPEDGAGASNEEETEATADTAPNTTVAAAPSPAAALAELPPFDEGGCCGFARLEGNVLGRMREAIQGFGALTESNMGLYICFDYRTDRAADLRAAFADPQAARRGSHEREMRLLRRECRGLLLCASTGTVLARRFHKFWNVGETPESDATRLFPAAHAQIAVKLDGSLCSPLLLDGQVEWATRKQLAPEIKAHVTWKQPQFEALARTCSRLQLTPLCEWCSSKHRAGVIAHAASSLTLLALRHNVTGSYLPRSFLTATAAAFDVPLVPELKLATLLDGRRVTTAGEEEEGSKEECEEAGEVLRKNVSDMDTHEGIVLWTRQASGAEALYKVKAGWWLAQAAASRDASSPSLLALLSLRPSLASVPPSAVLAACLLPAADDVMPACCALLPPLEAERLRSFAACIRLRLQHLQQGLSAWSEAASVCVREAAMGGGEARSAAASEALLALAQQRGWSAVVARALVTGREGGQLAERTALAQLRAADAEAVQRALWVRWTAWTSSADGLPRAWPSPSSSQDAEDEQDKEDGTAVLTPLYAAEGVLSPASPDLQHHVVSTYLPAKVARYLGIAHPTLDTLLQVPAVHSPSEGKLKGLWESFVSQGVLDLRVDLQPSRRGGGALFDYHNGSEGYAMWMVQWGASKLCARSSKPSPGCESAGAFGAVLMRTDHSFPLAALQAAFSLSLRTQTFVRLDPPSSSVSRSPSLGPCVGASEQEARTQELMQADEKQQERGGKQGKEEEEEGQGLQKKDKEGKKEEEEGGEEGWEVFCDLDGVLCDFEGGLAALLPSANPTTLSSKKIWGAVARRGGREFFENLAWTAGGKNLWQCLSNHPRINNVSILTGLPDGNLGVKAQTGKEAWCRRELGSSVAVRCCRSRDKHLSVKRHGRCILVDDTIALKAADRKSVV